ncbi:MAG: hypothetical protein EBV06_12020, partial [Planctomycetia bacterium]|nr:hypothetical protein [Planctomycetia bacterium]
AAQAPAAKPVAQAPAAKPVAQAPAEPVRVEKQAAPAQEPVPAWELAVNQAAAREDELCDVLLTP